MGEKSDVNAVRGGRPTARFFSHEQVAAMVRAVADGKPGRDDEDFERTLAQVLEWAAQVMIDDTCLLEVFDRVAAIVGFPDGKPLFRSLVYRGGDSGQHARSRRRRGDTPHTRRS